MQTKKVMGEWGMRAQTPVPTPHLDGARWYVHSLCPALCLKGGVVWEGRCLGPNSVCTKNGQKEFVLQ